MTHEGGWWTTPTRKRGLPFAGVRITRDDIAHMKDGAQLLRLLATASIPARADRCTAAAQSIERIAAQWEARRQGKANPS